MILIHKCRAYMHPHSTTPPSSYFTVGPMFLSSSSVFDFLHINTLPLHPKRLSFGSSACIPSIQKSTFMLTRVLANSHLVRQQAYFGDTTS
ncbi:hypothetical protein NPIL_487681 [Nephila pilipes]|uniref:Uncharacterized protein n=1 Tax=Nephila pilipes TaxID=299642 RepID=A0A8X6PX56_NEPPI|nr:hypothetical protein NPIL_487681 [Nephila pilipes]